MMVVMGRVFDLLAERLSDLLDWLRMERGHKDEVQTLFTRNEF